MFVGVRVCRVSVMRETIETRAQATVEVKYVCGWHVGGVSVCWIESGFTNAMEEN